MNCDSFLPAMETGGLVQRMLARCHAARCPRCAGVQAAFTATKQQLAAAEPLSLRDRQLWERAAGEVDLQPVRRRGWLPAVAGLGVATCVLLLVVAVATRPKPSTPIERPGVVRSVPGTLDREVLEEVSSADAVAQFVEAVDRLGAEVQRLQQRAEKLDAQQQITATLDRFDRW